MSLWVNFTHVGIFTAYAYSNKRIYMMNPNSQDKYINMTFTLIKYISNNQIFVNVTMYCYRHIIHMLLLHVVLHMYNVTQQNRCLTETVSTERRQPLLTTDTRVGHTCSLYHITQAFPHPQLSWKKIYCTNCQCTI